MCCKPGRFALRFMEVAALIAVALVAWRLVSRSTQLSPVEVGQPAPQTAAVEMPSPSSANGPVPQIPPTAAQSSSAESPPGRPAVNPEALDQRTLVGTKWEREGSRIEFGSDGRLFIGGSERAKWRVEGARIRLYRDATGEEHWLDIVGNKLMWEGQEISRLP
jgi:hypothetical protein